MAPEPASEKQRDYLCGLLKARGVREGDCPSLIRAVFPQGLTKREASAEIDQMKYMNGLPARWIHDYVRQLRKRHAIPVDALLEKSSLALRRSSIYPTKATPMIPAGLRQNRRDASRHSPPEG